MFAASQFQVPILYQFFTIVYRPIYPTPFRGRYIRPSSCVKLTVDKHIFRGEGSTRQQARHNAAAKALRVLSALPVQANNINDTNTLSTPPDSQTECVDTQAIEKTTTKAGTLLLILAKFNMEVVKSQVLRLFMQSSVYSMSPSFYHVMFVCLRS